MEKQCWVQLQERSYMLNGRGKTRSVLVILTNKLVKFLPIFKDTNYESKKKPVWWAEVWGLAARQMIVIYLLLDDLSLELVISDRESVKKKKKAYAGGLKRRRNQRALLE